MFLLIVPDVILILAGFILSRKAGWGAGFWSGLEKLVYYWLFPALLFRSIVHQGTGLGQSGALLWCVPLLVGAAALLAMLAGPVLHATPLRVASVAQCTFRFNSYIFLALSERIGGAEGAALAAVCIGIGVPLCNALAVAFLARHGSSNVLRELARNPLILATAAASIVHAAGWALPEPVDTVLLRAGNASLALGLMSVGAGVRFDEAAGDHALMVWTNAVKLLVLPALAWLLAAVFGLPPSARFVLVLFAAVPTAASSYILANRMGGDGRYVALTVSVSTIAAIVTLPFWLWLLGVGRPG